ncbi:hypothetical protein HGRIS_006462 [Hohenbuehelia grisea]|uniref:F-box domain-containing protein n=1 Tax=Hohenbuehelia grisea TaxID=104357 RepID=A0ABR3K1D4_9AGAR
MHAPGSSRRFDIPGKVAEVPNHSRAKVAVRPTSLVHLPLDTLVQILSLVSPRDIISLRKCCKTLATASRARIAWIHALRRICGRHYAFLPGFPIEIMSTLEIEHAATSPERLGSLLRKKLVSGSLQPLVTRVLQPRAPPNAAEIFNMPESEIDLGEFQDLALISGGRYVITCTMTGLVQLWDLGYNPNMVVNPFPLASMKMEENFVDMLTQPGPGSVIRLVLISRSPNALRVQVYEVNLSAENPSFKEINAFDIGVPAHVAISIDAFCLTRDRFSFHIYGRLCVWDFIEDAWALWSTTLPASQLHVVCDNVIQLSPDGIVIWGIPPLLPRVQGDEVIVENHSPLLHLQCPLSRLRFPYPLMWQTGDFRTGEYPLHFDVTGVDEFGAFSFVRYHLRSLRTANPEPDFPSFLPIRATQSTIAHSEFAAHGSVFRSGQLSDQDVLLLWRGPEGCVKGNISPWTDTRAAVVDSQTGFLWRPPTPIQGNTAFDLCPTTGRLVVLMFKEIRVMDYLLPPAQNDHSAGD